MKSSVKKYVLTGLMIALVFILTYVPKIPVPYTTGYIHLGDSMIYLSVIVLGPVFGAFASGVGSMLSDILGGYFQYAVPTLIIKSLMALAMGLILSAKTRKASLYSVFASLGIWTLFGAGTLFNLQSNIRTQGAGKILDSILAPDADAQTVKNTENMLNNLPLYLVLGIAAAIIVLAIAASLLSRKSSLSIFGSKAIIGMTAAGMCMVMGYFITESFMYGPIAATFSIPMNLIQFFAGVLVAGILAPSIKRASSVLNIPNNF